MKTLVLMRHGQTLFNEKKKIQGWCDSPLTALGRAQAEHARKYIDGLEMQFDYVCSSPLERCCDTLEIVQPDVPYSIEKGLKEMNFGRLEGEPEYLNPAIPMYSEYFSSAGGETREAVGQRMEETLRTIMRNSAHNTVFACSHGAAIKNFAIRCQKADGIEIPGPLHNCAVLVFDYDPHTDTFTLRDYSNPDYTQEDMQRDQKPEVAVQQPAQAKSSEAIYSSDVHIRPDSSLKETNGSTEKEIPRKKLILMRHGQTLFNEKKLMQGWTDAPLTDLGKAQIHHFRPRAQKFAEQADHRYSSSSTRACETMEIVTAMPYTRLKGLKEVCYGYFDGENQLMELTPEVRQILEYKNPYEHREDGYARFENTLKDLMAREDHQTVFCTSHGDVMHHFGLTHPRADTVDFSAYLCNGGIMVFDYDPAAEEFLMTEYYSTPYTEEDFERDHHRVR